MLKKLFILLTVIIVSFYYFPVNFAFLPANVNTKMIIAAIGLPILGFNLARHNDSEINKNFLLLTALALAVSLIAFASIVINNTPDYSYVAYVISMWVWLSGAYVTISLIRKIHGDASITLLCNYIITVCVFQCIIAIAIDQVPSVMRFVDKILINHDYIKDVDRLYGLGATLDTAGIRFSVAEVMIAYILSTISTTKNSNYMLIYIIAFIILVIIGNMVARTTSVGTILAIIFLFSKSGLNKLQIIPSQRKIWIWAIVIIAITIPITIYFYNTNDSINKNLRFAFEGFFNYFETGEWKIGSNETLKGMIVFPESLKTWIIGDGYFMNPIGLDPYYTGEDTGGYYMNSDIGYIRFIFYFGLIGLIAFSTFIFKSGTMALKKFPRHKSFIWFMLAINFICWIKVSTDIFLVFALLYMITKNENDNYDRRMALQ